MPDLLAIEDLRAGYGEAVVLRSLSLTLGAGEGLALLGRNGTGKTTLINSIVGVTRRFSGRLLLGGDDITRLRADQRARAGIGWVPQERDIFRSLSVEENMTAVARPGPWDVERVYTLFPRLKERRGNFGNQLSGGEQQMLAIGRALTLNPKVLLLDEPAAGVPESERHDILAAVAGLPRDVTVLLIEHDMDLVFSFADRISVLVGGAMLVEGAPSEVSRDPRVKAVYLGEGFDA